MNTGQEIEIEILQKTFQACIYQDQLPEMLQSLFLLYVIYFEKHISFLKNGRNICIVIICSLGRDVINFEINLSFLTKLLS